MKELTRDQCRKLFEERGLSYSDLTIKNLQRLRLLINLRMIFGEYMEMSYRCNKRWSIQRRQKHGKIIFAHLRCKLFYFNNRQAVTFEKDGFIGFAGWSDDTNIKPILNGFMECG